MKVLFRYLKPFIPFVALCVLLLFGQAMADLNLPNYMSRIVDTGIQRSGVEQAAPHVMSEDANTLLSFFLSDTERALLTDHYTLVSTGSINEYDDWLPRSIRKNGDTYDRQLTKAGSQVYQLTATDKDTIAQLDRVMGIAAWSFINVMREMAALSGQEAGSDSGDLSELELSDLYDLQPMLQTLPESLLSKAYTAAAATDDMLLAQSGAVFTQAIYRELGVDMAAVQSTYVLNIGLFMLLIAFCGGLASVSVSFLSTRVAAGVARNMRKDVFEKVTRFSSGEMDKFSTASLITRTTNDITQMQMVLTMGIRMLCYAPIMATGSIIMAVQRSVSMSWLIALVCVILIGMMVTVFSIAIPKFKLIQKLIDKLNLVSRESLSGLLVIRAFGTQTYELERFDQANTELTSVNLFVNRVMVVMMPVMNLLMSMMSVLIIWFGAQQIAASNLQVGDMMAFIQYAMHILMSFMFISMMFVFIPRAAVSGARIREVLDTEASISDPEAPEAFQENLRGVVTLRNVSFRYPGAEEDALQNISFVARPGETTAIIGSTGSGKSTLVQLLMRFYDITGGSLTVSGVEVSRVPQQALREKIGYVPQKGVLMTGDIRSNISYGAPEAGDAELEHAAAIAQAADFINEKPKRMAEPISQGGANVSGGQKQRLSIARALARKPEILIFDDSFSALDFKTDLALRKALKEQTGDSTVIVVAQRVNTIQHAEQIIVLDEGKVVGIGTHADLLKSCREYYEIASSQLSEEELA